MLKNVEAVIFDLDGTLIDSMWVWNKIDEEYLGSRNIEHPANLNEELEGKSFRETAEYFKERFQLSETIEEIEQAWHNMAWDKYQHEVKLKKGALKFLKYLKGQNIKIGIATSNSRELVELVTKANGINHFFDKIVTATEVQKGKPEPDVYLKVATGLNLNPANCLVFEDVVNGIIAGKRANMKVCAIYDEASKNTTEEKQKAADYYITDYEEIVYI